MKTKKNIFLWIMYDFANSIISIVFFLYFTQWVVIDRGIPDIFFNITFTVSAVALFITVPFAGIFLDRAMRRITGLRYTTIFTFIFYGLCAFYAVSNREVMALIMFTLGLYSYLLSFTFYTPLLNDIVSSEKIGLVSGLGISANYLGQFTGLALVLPFATGSYTIFNSDPRAETLLPAILVFFILSLPMLLFFHEPKGVGEKINLEKEVWNLYKETIFLFKQSGVAIFLFAYFLFNDAVLTASNNFSIFLEQVWKIPDTTKTYLLLGIIITSALGGTIAGALADKYGHKRTLVVILTGWVILLPFVGLLTNFKFFVVATIFMGFWFGANWAVSRSVMSYLAPVGKHNLSFAYFGLAERASSFLGPIAWGLIVTGLYSMGSNRYRVAVIAMTGFVALGLFFFRKVRSDREEISVENKSQNA